MANLFRKVVFKEHITGEDTGQYSAVLHYEMGPEHGHLAGTDMQTVIFSSHDGGAVYEVSKRLVDAVGCAYERVQE